MGTKQNEKGPVPTTNPVEPKKTEWIKFLVATVLIVICIVFMVNLKKPSMTTTFDTTTVQVDATESFVAGNRDTLNDSINVADSLAFDSLNCDSVGMAQDTTNLFQ